MKPWNKGLRGEEYKSHYKNSGLTPPNHLGLKRTEESKKRIRLSQIGKIVSENTKKTQSIVRKIKINRGDKDISIYGRDRNPSLPGELNPRWLGGISKNYKFYSKEFNKNFKKLIRKRDNYVCMLCGKHQEKEKKSLQVHHIDYNKKLSIPQNCISLCSYCHIQTKNNRKHWIDFFKSILSEKYDYSYEINEQPLIQFEIIKEAN